MLDFSENAWEFETLLLALQVTALLSIYQSWTTKWLVSSV